MSYKLSTPISEVESWSPERLLHYYAVASKIIAAENGTSTQPPDDPVGDDLEAALGFKM